MNIDYRDIGKRVRSVRTSRGITQEKLAEMVEVGTTHISHIETGNTIPSLKVFLSIANALSVSADELLCDNLNRSKPVYNNEITTMTVDCSPKELRIIAEMIKILKESLRKVYESGAD